MGPSAGLHVSVHVCACVCLHGVHPYSGGLVTTFTEWGRLAAEGGAGRGAFPETRNRPCPCVCCVRVNCRQPRVSE